MKYWFSLIICLGAISALSAQPVSDYPYWDFRSYAQLFARVGIRSQLGSQNTFLQLFAEADWCASCTYQYHKNRPQNVHQQLRNNRNRLNLHLQLATDKMFRQFGTRFYKKSSHPEFKNLSWTYITSVGFSYERGFYKPWKVADTESGLAKDAFFKRNRMQVRYDVYSRYHSYYYRKLSNTVGYITLGLSGLDDRWGANLKWGNDVFLFLGLKKFIAQHDHGETNSLFLSGYYRPRQYEQASTNRPVLYDLNDVQRVYGSFSIRMYTDRRTTKRSSSNQALYGVYDVIGLRNSFHGYWGFQGGVETGVLHAGLFLGADDLKLGRDLQRFAHQGNQHLPDKIMYKIGLHKFFGTASPLFPWEKQPGFYRLPKFLYEIKLDAYHQMNRSF